MKFIDTVRRIGPNIERAYREAAALSLSAAALFVSLVAQNHEWITGKLATAIPLALLFLMLSLYAVTLLRNKKTQLPLIGLSLVLTVAVYLLFLNTSKMSPYQQLGYVGSLLLVALASALKEGELKSMSEEFVNRLAKALQTILFGIVLYAGLSFLLLLIDQLIFKIPNVWRYYLDIFYGVALLFAVPFFITASEAPRTEEYPKLFLLLMDKVLIPLSYIYTIILYIFFARVLITRTWPEGLVSHLVLWYSLFVVALMIARRARSGELHLKDRFSLLVLPLMGILFLAISIRINAYGFTQNRILLIGAAIWSSVSLILLGVQKRFQPRVIVYFAMIITLVLMILPTNAWAQAVKNQVSRIEAILREEGMLQGEVIIPKKDLSVEKANKIRSSLNYLRYNDGLGYIAYIPSVETDQEFEAVFGIRPSAPDWQSTYFSYFRDEDASFALDGASSMRMLSLYEKGDKKVGDFDLSFDGQMLTIKKDGESTAIDVYAWATDEVQRELPKDWEGDFGKLRLYLRQVDGDSIQEKPIYSLSLLMFFYD
mgnify:CR=1 FL=1